MRVEFHNSHIIVYREKGDKAYYGIVNAAGESNLLYALKNLLNKMGYDLIKKRMWKDGNLVDDKQQYIRARKRTRDPEKDIYIFNGMWAIKGCEEDYNAGSCRLELQKNIFNVE